MNQCDLFSLCSSMKAGQCVNVSRQDLLEAAGGNLTSRVFDHVRDSDLTEMRKKMWENWGIDSVEIDMGKGYRLTKVKQV